MKKVMLAAFSAVLVLAACQKETITEALVSNEQEVMMALEPDRWIFQKWDGGYDDPCYDTGNRCATIIVGTELGYHVGLSNAIAAGGSTLSDFLYSSEGLSIPFDEETRSALASGQLTFHPLTAENGGIYYRYN